MNERTSVLHRRMIFKLSKEVSTECGNWEGFTSLLKGYIRNDPAKVCSIKNMDQAVTVLETKGMISVGHYEVLEQIFEDMEHFRCLEIIRKCMEEIWEESDEITIIVHISEQPAALDKNLFCETLKNEWNSRLRNTEMAQKDTILNHLSEKGMSFEIASTMQIKCKGVNANLLRERKANELSRIFQENLITEDILKKSGAKSIRINVALLDEHTNQEINRGQNQAATKGDLEKLAEEINSMKDDMATKQDINKILEALQQMKSHPAPADSRMMDVASSHDRETVQETIATKDNRMDVSSHARESKQKTSGTKGEI